MIVKFLHFIFLKREVKKTMDEKRGIILLVEDELKDLMDREFEINTNDFELIGTGYGSVFNTVKSLLFSDGEKYIALNYVNNEIFKIALVEKTNVSFNFGHVAKIYDLDGANFASYSFSEGKKFLNFFKTLRLVEVNHYEGFNITKEKIIENCSSEMFLMDKLILILELVGIPY